MLVGESPRGRLMRQDRKRDRDAAVSDRQRKASSLATDVGARNTGMQRQTKIFHAPAIADAVADEVAADFDERCVLSPQIGRMTFRRFSLREGWGLLRQENREN